MGDKIVFFLQINCNLFAKHYFRSQTEFEDGENTNSAKDKSETDKAKAKSNEHIEVLLKVT